MDNSIPGRPIRTKHHLPADDGADANLSAAAADTPAGGDGATTLHRRLTTKSVRRAMAGLDEDQRTILMLVCTEGLSYRQAAQVLEIPVGTVMSRLARAREALLRFVGQEVGEKNQDDRQSKLRLAVNNR
jgi:DNA-directed RNA polymerase specialized sigma24 family protein